MARNNDTTGQDVPSKKTPRVRKPKSVIRDAEQSEFFKGYVVAIGASAGGLDALERFFDELAIDSGAVIVVVQHLSPDHKSMMDNLLSRHTTMPVLMAENGLEMQANHVYLIPPGKNMTVAGSQLRLAPKNPHGLSLPIDLFFTSLSKEFGNRCVGVILSGTGSDGTRGAVAINDAGGFLLAQDPESAKFDGMPRSVIGTGLVDEVLPPKLLATRIVSHVKNVLEVSAKVKESELTDLYVNPMESILHLLYQVGGINFKEYKPATVQRRIERRMQIRHVRDLTNYLHLLESDRGEILTLKRDTLIPVTSFFRDAETFDLMEKNVIPAIISEHQEQQSIRVWVAGCSTGEEAYTIAILFAEAFDQLKRWPQLKIFATDVEQTHIDIASAGVYSEAIANELSPERLERFFKHSGNQFIVKNEIRQNIVFARHNILEDPPFTRMNLVTCRNVLIYFDVNAQEKALLRFQYALVHNGYMLLGSSESLGARHRDFSVSDSKNKIYRVLRPVSLPLDLNRGSQGRAATRKVTIPSQRDRHLSVEASVIESGQNILMKNYAPPALLVNEERQLVHVFGDAQRFMQMPTGTASLEVSKLLVGKLSPVGIALIHKAGKENVQLRSEVIVTDPGKGITEHVRMTVRPVPVKSGGGERFFLLSFDTEFMAEPNRTGSEVIDVSEISNERIQNLERELSAMRDSLQATIEELETSNEELQATNEELMASNEELQSTNEELQSVNEELYTVNAENQEKIEILNRLNADLDNMTRAALIPTVFVDENLKLTRFTPEAANIFRFREGDLGRRIDDFTNVMDYPEFISDIRRTLGTAQVIEREVKSQTGDIWYLVRILPYIDKPKNISGAVMTFFDISMLKDVQRLQGIMDSLPEHIAVLDAAGYITLINKAWRDFAEENGDKGLVFSGIGCNYLEAILKEKELDQIANEANEGIRKVLDKTLPDYSIKYPCHSKDENRWFLMHVAPVPNVAGGVVVSHINITHWIEGVQQ
ncbi:MAG: PAS domain-containing protein [Gammaproteobacteria bacterium]|nr:PAS domain-containing protein [Gammaproteobacteria bacterium]